MFLGDLTPELAGPHVQYATHYEPTPVADFEAFMGAVAIDWPNTTFVDVGSGMGRVVLLAARRPFKQIIGVELSSALHEVALENRKTWVDAHQQCTDVRFVRGDVCATPLPAGNLLLYLYNPFGRPVLTALLEKVLAQREPSREIVLCYHTPVEREAIDDTGVFELLEDLHFGLLYRLRNRQTKRALG